MFLLSAEQALGKPISILIPNRFHQSHDTHINNFAKSGVSQRSMNHLKPLSGVRTTGEEFPIEASISQVDSGDGRFFTVIVRDITQRTRSEEQNRRLAAELEAANDSLREQVQQRGEAEAALLEAHAELKIRTEEIEESTTVKRLVSDMGEFLQSCVTSAEASQVAEQSLRSLFPDSSGVVYLTRDYGALLEAFATWNKANSGSRETLEPQECWALRRGRHHVVSHSDASTKCAHLAEPTQGVSICVPMVAQGQPLGMLHVNWRDEGSKGSSRSNDRRENLALSSAETLALAIANVKLREKLKEQTIRDPLTQLYNRRYLEDTLHREIWRARRGSTPIGIIMIDVDNFKRFNDSFGHQAGDELLRTLGAYLKARVRPEDVPARYGGEEFSLVLPGACSAIVQARAETLREGFRNVPIGRGGSEKFDQGISLSFGVAIFPEHGQSVHEILRAADQALYEAKRTGKDRVIVFGTGSVRPEPQSV
jgi:diguanylate cyclase (GGDEF)-like protein/PAS domain S-box-containing protein